MINEKKREKVGERRRVGVRNIEKEKKGGGGVREVE